MDCPILHQLNAVHLQSMDNIISTDTIVHPNDVAHDPFTDDEIDTTWTSKLPPPEQSGPPESSDHLNGDPYTPPLAASVTLCRININDISKHNVPKPPSLSHDMTNVVRAQLDTGANITCSNLIDVLHDYRP